MPSVLVAIFVTAIVGVSQAEPPINIGLGDLGVGDGSYSSAGPDASYGVPGGAGGLIGGGGIGGGDVGGLSGYSGGQSFSSGYSVSSSNTGYDDGLSGVGGFSDGAGGHGHGEILATPAGKGVKYAGPIVYTNEKPPVIHFPPPPKPRKGSGHGKGGKGKGSKSHSIKYVPLPHHELPILIYQSDINPPIHVVSPPGNVISQEPPQASYGPPGGDYGVPSGPVVDYGIPEGKVVTGGSSFSQSTDYGVPDAPIQPQASYGVPSQASYGVPSQSSSSYGAPSQSSSSYGVPSQSSSSYGVPSQPSYEIPSQASYGAPSQSSYEIPSQISYGHSTSSFQSGSSKGAVDSIPTKSSYGPPKDSYGPPKKAASLPHIIYTGHPPIHIFQQPPIYMSAPKSSSTKSSYGSSSKGSSKGHGSQKGDHGHKGHHSKGEHGLHSLHSSIHNSLKSAFSSFHSSLPSLKASIHAGHSSHGHSHSHSKSSHKGKSNYVVAPKGWNKPPIIIYQGVRPPVTVYEKPAGDYDNTNIASGPISAPTTTIVQQHHHTGSPIALTEPVSSSLVLEGPISLEHAHVAGTDAPGNPAAHNVDITYGIQRLSPEVGNLVDPRYNNGQFATSRTIWIPNYSLPEASEGQTGQQPALYISDLTSAGQQFQILRRSDILDETILSGVSALKAEHENQGVSSNEAHKLSIPSAEYVSEQSSRSGVVGGQSQQLHARIEVLPTFLSTANEKTLGSIPVSYSSVIVTSAGASGASPSFTNPSNEPTSKTS
ncbi:unnamed protein product [Allacma fusca]|uniref:Uncharacterized protein n=1 Tax=Allacma fusca TaxID=39272 RepID=A0A8J2KUW0_9HEXA|nr:unnamed protein product [Allacma fusca]